MAASNAVRKTDSRAPTAVVADIATAVKNRNNKSLLAPPSTLSSDERELWSAVIASRGVESFTPADKPLLRAYVKAWSDINDIQEQIDRSGFLNQAGTKANPMLQALNYRINHMSVFFLRLGLQLHAPVNAADALAKANAHNRAREANGALEDDGDDGLLASPTT